jgi:hypothetical protein
MFDFEVKAVEYITTIYLTSFFAAQATHTRNRTSRKQLTTQTTASKAANSSLQQLKAKHSPTVCKLLSMLYMTPISKETGLM